MCHSLRFLRSHQLELNRFNEGKNAPNLERQAELADVIKNLTEKLKLYEQDGGKYPVRQKLIDAGFIDFKGIGGSG